MKGLESLSASTSRPGIGPSYDGQPGGNRPLDVDLTGIAPASGGGVESVAVGVVQGLFELGLRPRCLVSVGTAGSWAKQFPGSVPDFMEVASIFRAESVWQTALRRVLPTRWKTSNMVGLVRRLRARSTERLLRSGATWFPFHRAIARAQTAVVTVHDLRVFEAGLASEMDQSIIRENVSRAKAVICSWAHPYEHLIRLFPDAEEKVFRIALPVLNCGPAVKAHELSSGPIMLFLPASVTPHKNHELVLRAMAEREQLHLTCTGLEVEPFASELKQVAADLGVADRVTWLGYVDTAALEGEYQKADILVMPSRWEAASGPIFEAIVRELPFVASSIPPIKSQLVDLNLNAPTFDCDSVPEILVALDEVIGNYAQYRNELRGPARFLRSRTWKDTAEEYLQVFDWASGHARKPEYLQKKVKK
ncbi:glycosyltransferase [Pseudarthrobacter sp. NPDC055928]|uniref:glycosyltransferase n=1 Tax=Pseudarthrobacter sp. NPDC055928 TaxID=3345661 RepID=UPI0035D8F822